MGKIKNHILTNKTKIGKAVVISNILLPKGSCIPGSKITPTNITYHQTDCINVDAPRMHLALSNANKDPYAGTSASNYRLASWTITVGYNKIIQNIPLNWKAYAQGCSLGNNTGISVEMCMYTDKGKQYDTYLNAIALHKVLVSEYNSKLVGKSHYDWTKKHCPSWLIDGKYDYTLSWFMKELTKNIDSNNSSTSTYKQLPNGDYNKKAKIIVDELNVRKSRPDNKGNLGKISFKLKKGDVVYLGYVFNGWGSVWFKGKQGYVNTSSKYLKSL